MHRPSSSHLPPGWPLGPAGNTYAFPGLASSEMMTLSRCHAAPMLLLSWPMLIAVRSPRSGISMKNTSRIPRSKLFRLLSNLRLPLVPFEPTMSMLTLASVPANLMSLVITSIL